MSRHPVNPAKGGPGREGLQDDSWINCAKPQIPCYSINSMKKQNLIHLIVEILQRDEDLLTRANLAAKEAATESEAKPENQYDTRALEQSYLAAGQAKRIEEVRAAIQRLRSLNLIAFEKSTPIEVSAIVTLEDEDGQRRTYFLIPSHGGLRVSFMKEEIYTLSPESPLGESLLEKQMGDSIEVRMSNQMRSFQIVHVE
jgi:transcription elongation GreA/GreB family factor